MAIQIYEHGSDPDLRQGEIARTKYQLSLVLRAMGNVSVASAMHQEAESMWLSLSGNASFPSGPEPAKKYDELVSLWAR